jgi:uncharacterized membrane protein
MPASSDSFNVLQVAAAYGAALLVIGALDALWLGWLARGFYRDAMGDLMRPDILWGPALVFYFAYPAGVLMLALSPMPLNAWQAAGRGALLGLVVYGVYDMTNLATLKGWSWKLSLLDMAWGTLVTCLGAVAAWSAWSRFTR